MNRPQAKPQTHWTQAQLDAQPFGLAPQELADIQRILAACPAVEAACIFGSRALGRQRPGSDVDLALRGPQLTQADVYELMDQLEALELLLRYDLVLLDSLQNPALREHIERVGQWIFVRKTA